jgi:HJR/Mrr/RecB family endonuclease
MGKKIKVVKYDGRIQEFNRNKLLGSLLRSRVPRAEAEKIIREVENQLYDKISTREIYQIIYKLLLERGEKTGYQLYRLREALSLLDSRVFEEFVGRLLEKFGYQCVCSQVLKGACSEHEIDVVAQKKRERYLVEVKHHQNPHRDSGLIVVLALWARLEDLKEKGEDFDQAWLFTNTKFSNHAKKYAQCKNIRLTGWRYSASGAEDTVERMIERLGKEEVGKLVEKVGAI